MAGQTDKRLAVGSWSEGSTRTEDILDALDSMARSVGIVSSVTDAAAHAYDAIVSGDDHECDDDDCTAEEYASEAADALIDALGEYAPIYCYIGMHPGDGADFGVWPSELALAEAIENAQPMPSDDESKINIEDGVIITVNDHGNVTVYAIERGPVLLSLV
jgi:hypothetical protein